MDGKARVRPDSGAVAETMFTWNSKNTAKSARYEIKKTRKGKPMPLHLRPLIAIHCGDKMLRKQINPEKKKNNNNNLVGNNIFIYA